MNTDHEKHIERCLYLAGQALGKVSPNPLVGAVIVHENDIIGEGFHQQYGGAHAEVEAIREVQNPGLLPASTLYVNLEPCAHQGKTPPCTDLIIEKGIKKVVISCIDPNPLVAGKGIEKLKQAGIEVVSGLLEEEARELNKRFFTFHQQKRPYIILKWAQTADGFISRFPLPDDKELNWISGKAARKLVHVWRSQEDAIMIGTNTALNDNPQLTTRLVEGRNPVRVVIDKQLMIPEDAFILNEEAPTLVFTTLEKASSSNVHYITIDFEGNRITKIVEELYQRGIGSVIIEGGAILLNSFLEQNLWDEARVIVGTQHFEHGIKAPLIQLSKHSFSTLENDRLYLIKNKSL